MGIEFAGRAAVEPVVQARVPTDITREPLVLVRRREDEVERVRVRAMVDGERLGGALTVQPEATWIAVKREAAAAAAARVAVGRALFGRGRGEEVEGVRMRRMADAPRHLGAGDVQDVVACLARVDTSGGRRGATSADRRGQRLLRRRELERMGMAEMADPWIVARRVGMSRMVGPWSIAGVAQPPHRLLCLLWRPCPLASII